MRAAASSPLMPHPYDAHAIVGNSGTEGNSRRLIRLRKRLGFWVQRRELVGTEFAQQQEGFRLVPLNGCWGFGGCAHKLLGQCAQIQKHQQQKQRFHDRSPATIASPCNTRSG